YGATETGLTVWNVGVHGATEPVLGMAQSVVKDFHVWHVTNQGYYGYPTSNFLFDGFVGRNDRRVLASPFEGGTGLYFGDYLTTGLIVRNADIQGFATGIQLPSKVGDTRATGQTVQTVVVENSYLRNYVNVVAETMYGTTGGGTALSPRESIIRDVT